MTPETRSALKVGGIALAAVVVLFIILGVRGGNDPAPSTPSAPAGTHAHDDGQVHADHAPAPAAPSAPTAPAGMHDHGDGHLHADHGPAAAAPPPSVEEATEPTLGLPAPDLTQPFGTAPAPAPARAPEAHGHDHGHSHGPDGHSH